MESHHAEQPCGHVILVTILRPLMSWCSSPRDARALFGPDRSAVACRHHANRSDRMAIVEAGNEVGLHGAAGDGLGLVNVASEATDRNPKFRDIAESRNWFLDVDFRMVGHGWLSDRRWIDASCGRDVTRCLGRPVLQRSRSVGRPAFHRRPDRIPVERRGSGTWG